MHTAQDMDFFGEVTPEEQAAADEKNRIIAEAKARGAAKAKLSKSMIIMDVKPWDDTTGEHLPLHHPTDFLHGRHSVAVADLVTEGTRLA